LLRTLSFDKDRIAKEIAMNTPCNHKSFALILLLCGLLFAGCVGPKKSVRLHCYIGLDASGSARTHLGGYTLLSGQIAARLTADTDILTLFRLDDQVTEFSNKPASGSMETTLTAITQNVQQLSPGRGTFPAKYWEETADRAEQSRDNSVILLFSDGDNDDQRASSAKAIRAAIARLAKNPRVKEVIVCGVERRNYASLQSYLAPLGEDRFHLLNPTEMEIDTLAGYLREARAQPDVAANAGRTPDARR
jgi:hypothetical protein